MKDYDKFSKTFANSRRNMIWPEIDYFVDFINITPVFMNTGVKKLYNILDIGCGSGRLLNFLQKLNGSYQYLGIDSSSGMIEEASREFPDNEFRVLDMTELDKLTDKFDIIFFIASFHHLQTREKRLETLAKAKQILNEKGLILMTNWNLLGVNNFKKYEKMHTGNGDFQIKIGEFNRYYHGFTLTELESLFVENGFKAIKNIEFENGNNIVSIIEKAS